VDYESPQIEARTPVSAPLNLIAGTPSQTPSPKWRSEGSEEA